MKINGKNYNLKYSLRSMFIWENICEKPFQINTMMDTYLFFYSCILADESNPKLDFDELINACDENPFLMTEFNDFMAEEMEKRNLLGGDKKKVVEENS